MTATERITLSPALSPQGRGGYIDSLSLQSRGGNTSPQHSLTRRGDSDPLSPGGRGLGRGGMIAIASLFTSSGTLVCCALPALLVALGAGAVLSSLVSSVPALVVLSEYKEIVFIFAGLMLAISGWLQWQSRFAPCPVDPQLRDACLRTRNTSAWIYGISVLIFLVGGFFAFVLPVLL